MTDDGEQVLAWYAKGQERGRRAAVGQERRRVLRVGLGGINDIRVSGTDAVPRNNWGPDLGQGRQAARNHYNGEAVDLARTVRP